MTYREQIEVIALKVWRHEIDTLECARQILNIPITRPCKKCGGSGYLLGGVKCPTCKDGVETTTLGKLEEEWRNETRHSYRDT